MSSTANSRPTKYMLALHLSRKGVKCERTSVAFRDQPCRQILEVQFR
jgi:hypothetical protein